MILSDNWVKMAKLKDQHSFPALIPNKMVKNRSPKEKKESGQVFKNEAVCFCNTVKMSTNTHQFKEKQDEEMDNSLEVSSTAA